MQQYSLNFDIFDDFLEENYIVSSSNLDAYNLIVKNFPNNFGINPYRKTLLLIGDKASGKTHISSIWANKYKATFLDAHSTMPNNIPLAVIDGVESYDETFLLHLFNYYNEENRFLLMTASSLPNFKLKDLESRINAIHIVRIGMPDHDMIKIMLMRCFSNRSIKISSNVIDYLAARVIRNCRYIKNTVAELDTASKSYKKAITIPFVKEVLNHHI